MVNHTQLGQFWNIAVVGFLNEGTDSEHLEILWKYYRHIMEIVCKSYVNLL